MRGSPKRRIGVLVAGLAVAALLSACGIQPSEGAPACDAPAGPPDAVTTVIFNRVNSDRAASGLAPVTWNRQLYCLALDWSSRMTASGDLHHRDLSAVINSADYRSYTTIGENILRGPSTLSGDAMEDAWMNSPSHRENILAPSFTSIGIATVGTSDGQTIYATQNFGG
jgi:uncharacterized protein YkwD